MSDFNSSENSIYRYLDTNGDGTGTKNAIGDYSGAVEEFYIQAPLSYRYRITRMLVYIEDNGAFDSDSYANSVTLTNGIEIETQDADGNMLIDLTDSVPIKTNGHWARLCYDADQNGYGIGNEYMAVRWTFEKSGRPLDLDVGDKLVVKLNDNFSTIVEHYFLVQGHII